MAGNQFCNSGLWQGVFESASRAGVLRKSAQQSADGFLHAGDDRQRRATARRESETGLCHEIRLALHGFERQNVPAWLLRGERIASGTRRANRATTARRGGVG